MGGGGGSGRVLDSDGRDIRGVFGGEDGGLG